MFKNIIDTIKTKWHYTSPRQKKIIKISSIVLFTILFISSIFLIINKSSTLGMSGEMLGGSFPDSQWYTVDKFQGYQTKSDPTKVSTGANPYGQNTLINDGDRISARNYGYKILGTATTTEDAITALHTFRKRSGENILMRSRGTYVEYWEEGTDTWNALITTSTDGITFGFADFNINTDLQSYVYFGNGIDPFMRWTGAHSLLTQSIAVGTTTLHLTSTSGFSATGTIRYCGINSIYTSLTATTITLSSPTTIDCSMPNAVAQTVTEYPAYPRGNIYSVFNNRLLISGIPTLENTIYFSRFSDPLSWYGIASTLGTSIDAGVFNLGEGGGSVTGIIVDEGAAYFFKKNITYKTTLNDASLFTTVPLKPFDGKSQTTGNTNNKLVFTGANGTYFVTPDNQIMSLSRIDGFDYPQLTPISYPIQPTTNIIDFSKGVGIFFKQNAYFSAKSSIDSQSPDIILVYNPVVNVWESPIIGWSASDFTVYDDGTGESLYYGDANTANVYKVINDSSDNGLAFTSSWRSKQFTFTELGSIADMKQMDSVFVEGYISDNTKLTISLLLDEDGFTQSFSTTIDGSTDTGYLFSSVPYNIFGLHPFGYLRFGSSDVAGLKKFRVYLSKDFRAYSFYNAQIEFGSSSEGQAWEVTSFGFKVRKADQPEKRSLYKAFK